MTKIVLDLLGFLTFTEKDSTDSAVGYPPLTDKQILYPHIHNLTQALHNVTLKIQYNCVENPILIIWNILHNELNGNQILPSHHPSYHHHTSPRGIITTGTSS